MEPPLLPIPQPLPWFSPPPTTQTLQQFPTFSLLPFQSIFSPGTKRLHLSHQSDHVFPFPGSHCPDHTGIQAQGCTTLPHPSLPSPTPALSFSQTHCLLVLQIHHVHSFPIQGKLLSHFFPWPNAIHPPGLRSDVTHPKKPS